MISDNSGLLFLFLRGGGKTKDQKFGIEIELTGLARASAADIIAKYFDTEPCHENGIYDTYIIMDRQNRKWKVVRDSSIHCTDSHGTSAGGDHAVEVVSPICVYDDIVTIQHIIRALRAGGAVANYSCGIHIHINGAPYDAKTLRNLTNIMNSKEDLIYKALNVNVARENGYCKKTDQSFLEELNRKKPKSIEAVQKIWYKGDDGSFFHYHESRYHCLNLHSLFSKGTIEFRLFNSTTHAGKIKAYIQFCLAISNQALTQRCASRRVTASSNEKYTFRTWLLRLGMIGDEFKTARLHLLKNLDGCIAWKDPHQAELQRERLAQRQNNRDEEENACEEAETSGMTMNMQ